MRNDVLQYRPFHYFIITVLVIISYMPTFTGDFIFDDQTLIKNNPYIMELHSLSSYLAQEDGIADPRDQGIFHTGYYRPLLNLSYFLDYKLWGMKAAGFRTTNLILHLLTSFLLYEFLLLLTGYQSGVFWAVLLFSLHPVQTESVAMIVSRNNIMATFFILAAGYCYIAWWRKNSPMMLACSLIAFAGALFSKEFGIMTLPILFIVHRFLGTDKNRRRELESYVPFLILAVIYLIIRKTVVSSSMLIPDDIWVRLYFVPYLIACNLKLIFLPVGLHSFSVVYPLSLLSGAALWSFFVVVCLGGVCWAFRKERLLIFSVTAFIVSLLPVINIIPKVSISLVAMRWLYLPVSFVAVGLVWLIAKIMGSYKRITVMILMAVTVYFVAYSYILNAHLWHDEKTFLKQEVLHFNNDLYAGDYAEMMFKEKNYQEAEGYFLISMKKYPYNPRTYINYGALLIETGRPREALAVLEKARPLTMIHKDRGDWHNNMGVAMTLLDHYEQAYQHFNRSLELAPQSFVLHRNMAVLMARQGRMAEAKAHLSAAERLVRPDR